MKRWIRSGICFMAALSLVTPVVVAAHDHDDGDKNDGEKPLSVTVSFGAGLNTSVGINSANHHILPPVIEIRAGGVVNFAVSGLHQIVVYFPGKRPKDVDVPPFDPTTMPPTGLFINDFDNVYYFGINPSGANPVTPPPGTVVPPAGVFNGPNRVEAVSFPGPGKYLVICNVNPHFQEGMWAWVKVS